MIRAGSVERLMQEETAEIASLNVKMVADKALVNCYNRGCGQKFDPDNNGADACLHHPGEPVFHDAYKFFSCCNKKCTDFTEFLNTKGCTRSCHSDVKPPEPEKPAVDKSKAHEVIEVRSEINTSPALQRPPFDTPCYSLNPTISPALLEQIKGLTASSESELNSSQVVIGQSCKNKSCKAIYKGPESDNEICLHHPGVPIFHEGMKFWSCCQKRTTDFTAFLEQVGCAEGQHVWIAQNTGKNVSCRLDWHQTGTFVYISIYAKKYDPNQSSVKLNPIRLMVDLYFPEESSSYNLDIELRGIVDIEQSTVSMLPTKLEIKLRKKEPGSWAKLDFPRKQTPQPDESEEPDSNSISAQVDAVDLSDL